MAKKPNAAAAPTKPDTSGLRAQLGSIEAEKIGIEGQKQTNNEKIERLRKAKTSLREIFDDLMDILYRWNDSTYDLEGEWDGTKYKEYSRYVTEEFKSDFENFIGEYGKAEEYFNSIIDKINELERVNRELDTQLTNLSNSWNSINSQIQALS